MSQPAPLPVIDLSAPERDAHHRAARDVGFFQLVGHGVTLAEQARLLGTARDFSAGLLVAGGAEPVARGPAPAA